ncbi:MAG: nucleoside-triphosphatase [Candidatus Aminicenantales bacterium]
MDSARPVLRILTGPVHSGKTSLLKAAAGRWKSEGRRVGGFLNEMRREGAAIIGYDLLDLADESSVPFLRKEGGPTWEKAGSYLFVPGALGKARDILARDRAADLLVVDEVGPLELSGGGYWKDIRKALSSGTRSLWVVRASILESLGAELEGCEIREFRVDTPGVLDLLTADLFPGAPPGDGRSKGHRG